MSVPRCAGGLGCYASRAVSRVHVLPTLAAAGACLLASASARAETRGERLSLAWSAPEGCPSEEDVLRRMQEAVGDAERSPRLRVRARVTREGDTARLVLAVGESGERVMEAPTCDALAASAAVVVGMSIREAAPVEAAPVAPVERPREAPPPAPTEPRTSLRVRVEGGVDVGTLPVAAPGGGLALGVAGRRLSGEVAVTAFASQRATSSLDPSRGADFGMLAASLRACWAVGAGAVEVAPCLGARVARITGQGLGARRVEEGAGLAGGPEVGLAVRAPLGRVLAIRAGASVAVPIGAQAFVITALGTVHEPSAVTVQAAIGPEVSF